VAEKAGSREGFSAAEWGSAEEFVGQLQKLIDEGDRTIRETDFAVAGTFRDVTLHIEQPDGLYKFDLAIVLDKLDRVFVPVGEFDRDRIIGVSIPKTSEMKNVVRRESRYEGEKEVAYVLYLE
jgi:hypothetical protein